ncbi:MAG: zinc-dependent alcohol dehydrogenase family protein [Gammaproteobacteria bacterium]
MKCIALPRFGLEYLAECELEKPEPEKGEVLVRFGAASVNSRDLQIINGTFSPTQTLPIIPLSDGAGEVVAVGSDIKKLAEGDLVCPLFFPEWIAGEATTDERSVSSGLEAPGVLREYGAYREHQVLKMPAFLDAGEAACFPCAGLTAWVSLANAHIGAGDWVLVQGTGGVSLFGLQFAKALGASVIVTSGNKEKLERATLLGADAVINYSEDEQWGATARDIADGLGVHAVLEIGGTGTLPQSIQALRRGGHINIIGYFAGIDVGLTVFDFIERNAHVHGLSVGSREDFEQMLDCVAEHEIHPVISRHYKFTEAAEAIAAIGAGRHFGKLVISIG